MLALKKEYVVEVLPHDLNDLFGGEGTELMFSWSKPVDHHEFDGAGTELYFHVLSQCVQGAKVSAQKCSFLVRS